MQQNPADTELMVTPHWLEMGTRDRTPPGPSFPEKHLLDFRLCFFLLCGIPVLFILKCIENV